MTALRQKMIDDMKLRRFARKTQLAYIDAVVGLSKFYNKSPERLTEENVQNYLLHLIEESKLSWSSCNVVVSGLRFFYGNTLKNKSIYLAIPPRKQKKQLPEILSTDELERLFASTANPKHRMVLMTTYAAGLRVSEVVSLKLKDIESDRMMIRVDDSKGNKDRYTILSKRLLQELRPYFILYRPQFWLFPAKSDPQKPLHIGTAQKIYYTAKKRAGIKRAKGIHTLRHCFATHMLEAGEDPCTIQMLMGHSCITTTMGYLQVTRKKLNATKSPLDLLEISNTLIKE